MKESGSFLHHEESEEEKAFHNHLEEKTIEDFDQLVYSLKDARNQFQGIKYIADHKDGNQWIEEEFHNHEKMYLIEYLKTHDKNFSEKFLSLESVQGVIRRYNVYVDNLKASRTKEEVLKTCSEEERWFKSCEKNMYNFIYKDEQFWDTFSDMKNQFVLLEHDFSSNMSIEEIIERNKARPYKTFEQLLEEKNKRMSADLFKKGHYKQYIDDFNSISARAANFMTKDELKIILEEVHEFLRK